MKKLFCRKEGSGPPLLLLHGFLEDHTIWKAIIPELKERFTLIMPDLPGHGRSGSITECGEMDQMAGEVIQLIDREQYEKVHVAGHSMGGYVALEIVRINPDWLGKACLLFSTTENDSNARKVERDRAARVYSKSPELFAREAIPNLFAPANRPKLKTAIQELIAVASHHNVKGVVSAIEGMKNRRNFSDYIVSNNIDLLFVQGEEDPVVDTKRVEEIASRSSQLTTETIDGCAHMGMVEDPVMTALILLHYLEN